MPKRRAASRLLLPSIRTAKRTFAYSSTPFIPQPSAFNAKSFLPPEFYSGATGQPGHFSEGFCLRRVHPLFVAVATKPLGREPRARIDQVHEGAAPSRILAQRRAV